MPTTHVEPGCDPLLQDIANALWKARKVVVITGAGISTNSGIPDFRSENGLYSLIQAQFDAAQQQASGRNSDAEAPDASEERPPKRQRVSRADPEAASQPTDAEEREDGTAPHVEAEEGQTDAPGKEPLDALPELSLSHPSPKTGPSNDTEGTMAGIEPEDCIPVTPLTLPSLRPPPNQREPPGAFASSPPRLALGTPRSKSRHLEVPRSWSSSPLSSPPPVMFDPYQESPGDTSNSSSQDSGSSRSESEEPSSVSTPLLTSQTSFGSSSSRTSLPNMKGRDLFDAQIWSCPTKTSVFYTFATTLRQKVRNAEPTSSHHFVSVLRDSMKLVRCYTQNIDQLEERVGLTTSLSLGAGNRYRFSVRAGRSSGVAKGSTKGAEGPDGSQGSSQQDEQQPQSQSQDKLQASQAESSRMDDTDEPPSATQSSQSAAPDSASAPAPAPPKRGVECVFLHGSLADLRCFVCARTASWDDESRLADTMAGRQPICPHCAGATAAREEKGKRALGVGKLRPDIVLYGEEHPHAHLISPLVQHDLSLGPDMLLILGTSMRVHGLRVLVKEFAKAVHDRGGKVVFVNFTKPPESVWAEIIDYWVQWDCDTWVGDLQQRKPALWLPPGAAPREDEKQKAAKASRRQSSGDIIKKKDGADKASKKEDGADKASKKARESDGPMVVQEPEVSGLSGPGLRTEPEEMPPPQLLPPPKAVPKRPARVAREPKLNPDAKRPASIRDHKQNGAYCVWKILDDLHRITGGSLSTARSPSAIATRPKAKKPRKSAPAALETHDTIEEDNPAKTERDVPTAKGEPATPASSPAPGNTPEDADPEVPGNSSISAAVKSRKRKQTVTWRMIGGVETRVSLNDAGEFPSPLPHTSAVLRPAPVDIPRFRALPRPTPPPPPPTSHPHTPTIPGIPSNQFVPPPIDIDAGFRETDRLIAKAQEVFASSTSSSASSRPTTPPQSQPQRLLRLPPLNLGLLKPSTAPFTHHPPALAALEPKVESPGPRAEISSNVGSPVEVRRMSSAGGGGNPFFFADAGVEWLRWPPVWLGEGHEGVREKEGGGYRYEREGYQHQHQHQHQHGHEKSHYRDRGQHGEYHHHQQQQQHHQQQQQHPPQQTGKEGGGVGQGRDGRWPGGGNAGEPWCPDEQLRKEQEAALMLSALRGEFYG